MGVNKLWDAIRARYPQEKEDTVPLPQLGEEYLRKNGRPFRVAVDVYPRIFADKGATDAIRDSGGMNHASKNVFYLAMHFLEAGVQPVFVYDGDGKPAFKRQRYHDYRRFTKTKRFLPRAESSTTRSVEDKDRDQSLAHIVQLTRETFTILGLPWVDATGEAEAECCAMQRAGLVDGVVTTDGDAFIFGSSLVLDLCNNEGNKPRRAYVYTSRNTMSRGFCLLFALVSGGDYTNGLKGYGPNAVQDLYDAFGEELNRILGSEEDVVEKVVAWSEQLGTKLKQSSIPRSGDLAKKLSRGFPKDVVQHYLDPSIHPRNDLRQCLPEDAWVRPMNVSRFRLHTEEYFDWKGRYYARKFAKNICPALMVRYLMIQGLQRHTRQLLPECGFRLDRAKVDDVARIKVFYNPEQLLQMKVSAEPVIEGYLRDFKFDPSKDQFAWLPRWLIEYGAPVSYTWWHNSKGKSLTKAVPRKAPKARKRSQPGASNDDNDVEPTTPQRKRYRARPTTQPLAPQPMFAPSLSQHSANSSVDLPPLAALFNKDLECFGPHAAHDMSTPEFDKDLSRATNLSRLDAGSVEVIELNSSPC
ncbi:PIN domain-like protein [Exophiala viscosa]|uniref:PIN domain-like protein n=1 Tax=Exophiala viscosa TaxID=2486360 RepID=UPI002193FBCD|nr:PIN domain-like protein [Exophiala viscosa]